MQFFRGIYAECLLLRPRLTRTRLGFWLVVIGGLLVWLRSRGLDPVTIVLQAAALGAVIGAAFMAGSNDDRAAFTTALTHPTTPLAIATGRWLAVVAPAAALSTLCAIAVGGSAGSAAAGVVAAMAVGGCSLAIVLAMGQAGAVVLFFFMSIAGVIPPERLIGLTDPGVPRLAAASALELGPALWHYRDVIAGDLGALLHAVAWSGLGIMMASAFVARRR